MLYYALHSRAGYETKMENLTRGGNYCLLLQYEETRATMRCGF